VRRTGHEDPGGRGRGAARIPLAPRALAIAIAIAIGVLAFGAAAAEPAVPAAVPASDVPASIPAFVELNTATRARLESIRGIGPGLAAALISARSERAFVGCDDLVHRVHGIGRASAWRISLQGLRVAGEACDAPAMTHTPETTQRPTAREKRTAEP
jgi:competence protein ComEA